MWLALFKYKYEDFQLDLNDIHIYKELVNKFALNLFEDMVAWEPSLDVFQVPRTISHGIALYYSKNDGLALLPLKGSESSSTVLHINVQQFQVQRRIYNV